MTPTIIKAADAAEFLSFVPSMLGYRPRRSLVVIPFHGSRSLGAMRFDLPEEGSDDIESFASTVVGMACRVDRADALVTIVYTDAPFGGERMPHRPLLAALERRADSSGMRLSDSLCVAADGWGSHLDPACPRDGRPLAELTSAAMNAELLREPVGDQATGASLPDADLATRERVGRALAALDRAVRLVCGDSDDAVRSDDFPDVLGGSDLVISPAGSRNDLAAAPPPITIAPDELPDAELRIDPRALESVCRLDDVPDLYEAALGWSDGAIEPFDAALLIWCLARPSLRDVALVQWAGTLEDGDEALEAQLQWESGEEYPAHLAMRMWGDGERPDPARLKSALAVARAVAVVAPRASSPGPLAMCAWLSWALGRSTHADWYASRACRIEPEHGLSEIVISFVRAAHLPDWAFRR